MKKIWPILLAALLLTGGTAWAKHSKSDSAESDSQGQPHSKHSKGHKSTKKKGKKAKKGKSSKSKSDVKMEGGIGESDVTIDLKGK